MPAASILLQRRQTALQLFVLHRENDNAHPPNFCTELFVIRSGPRQTPALHDGRSLRLCPVCASQRKTFPRGSIMLFLFLHEPVLNERNVPAAESPRPRTIHEPSERLLPEADRHACRLRTKNVAAWPENPTLKQDSPAKA